MTKPLPPLHQADFEHIHQLIQKTQGSVWKQVNTALIQLYWAIGEYISDKTTTSSWGRRIVEELAHYLSHQGLNQKGFSARNLWRMKQFYETYKDQPKLSSLMTEITWTHHLHILSKTKTLEEKAFYLQLAAKHPYSVRDLARLIDTGTYERSLLADQKLSSLMTEIPHELRGVFKDTYVFEFTGLSEDHKEYDLRKALLHRLKSFLMEMGPDFSYIGEEYVVQVGMKDYKIDLLLQHRGLNCLICVELKVTEFQPEFVGKMQFYLEALDRDVKKPHERPSMGILICKTKDDEVVNYAMSRNVSPTLIAEYETKLIDKKLLQRKLHELLSNVDMDPAEDSERLEDLKDKESEDNTNG